MSDQRQRNITEKPFSGNAVLYVMSRDQRAQDNHALLAAQALANEKQVPLYVLFVLKKIESRSREHYQFMLDGLKHLQQSLADYGIPFIMRSGDANREIQSFAKEIQAGAIVFDFSPLQFARALVDQVAKEYDGPVSVVDAHNIIPAWVVSDKQEYAAHTMRAKVHKNLETYLIEPPKLQKQSKPQLLPDSMTFDDAQKIVDSMNACGIRGTWQSGELAALQQLDVCIDDLEHYAMGRNNIAVDQQSGLSPYLHFGQISSLRIALNVMHSVAQPPLLLVKAKLLEISGNTSREDGMNALFEEMIVRKELSDNFCLYADDYTSLKSVPAWAQKSLEKHRDDPRDFVYTLEQWEQAKTHDEVWNAAQLELTKYGKMHGYMRMYWAKKLLEWSKTPEDALRTAIYLNDTYSIDGGDPNGYVGILWSIAGLHDRPWFERSVYGQIRYMNSSGLRKKFDVDAYIERIHSR